MPFCASPPDLIIVLTNSLPSAFAGVGKIIDTSVRSAVSAITDGQGDMKALVAPPCRKFAFEMDEAALLQMMKWHVAIKRNGA